MLDKQISETITTIISELYGADNMVLPLEKTPKEQSGDFTVIIFPILKLAKQKPEDAAKAIGDALIKSCDIIEGFEVIKGFLNLRVTDQALYEAIKKHNCSIPKIADDDSTYLVEYSSPNTNKPLHLGHIRNNLIGYSISKILQACGHRVKMIQIINDRGIHICKSMLAWQRFGNEETPKSTNIKGDHFVGKYYVEYEKQYRKEVKELVNQGLTQEEAEKQAPLHQQVQKMLRDWEKKDPDTRDLWKKMNQWVYDGFDESYQRLGVSFDKNYYESNTYLLGKQVIADGLAKKIFYQKEDGSIWVDLTDEGLDEKLLLRADGTAVYITQDIGTAIERYQDYQFGHMIYTVADEQDYHFQVLFLILKKLGYPWAKNCYHLSYGMVTLPSGKMKSREGTVVDADDLMNQMHQTARSISESRDTPQGDSIYEMIGMAALKYQLLRVDPKKTVLFDPETSIDFHGKTGPFIQYTYARIQSIIRKYGAVKSYTQPKSLHPEERNLIKKACDYQNQVIQAAKQKSPALLANYLYELVKIYNGFYQENPILNADKQETTQFRVTLSHHIASIIERAAQLLGFDVPDHM
jgi:arginyl-tRNA synthetase